MEQSRNPVKPVRRSLRQLIDKLVSSFLLYKISKIQSNSYYDFLAFTHLIWSDWSPLTQHISGRFPKWEFQSQVLLLSSGHYNLRMPIVELWTGKFNYTTYHYITIYSLLWNISLCTLWDFPPTFVLTKIWGKCRPWSMYLGQGECVLDAMPPQWSQHSLISGKFF